MPEVIALSMSEARPLRSYVHSEAEKKCAIFSILCECISGSVDHLSISSCLDLGQPKDQALPSVGTLPQKGHIRKRVRIGQRCELRDSKFSEATQAFGSHRTPRQEVPKFNHRCEESLPSGCFELVLS